MTANAHGLVLNLRDPVHVHKVRSECRCGWVGIPLRKAAAMKSYRDHVNVAQSEASARRRGRGLRWSPSSDVAVLTPVGQLPEALR